MLERVQEMSQDMIDTAKKVWFASLGAVLAVEEKGVSLFHDLLKKGAEVEADRLAPVAAVADTMKNAVRRTTDTFTQFGKDVDLRVSAAMQRAGIPNRGEIATLTERVEALNASIEKMKVKAKPAAKAEAKHAKA